jgi:hypothetical protein
MKKTIREKVVSRRTATLVHACVLDYGGYDAALSRTACTRTPKPCGPCSAKNLRPSAKSADSKGIKPNQANSNQKPAGAGATIVNRIKAMSLEGHQIKAAVAYGILCHHSHE